jgi:hypothetical protein
LAYQISKATPEKKPIPFENRLSFVRPQYRKPQIAWLSLRRLILRTASGLIIQEFFELVNAISFAIYRTLTLRDYVAKKSTEREL